LQAIERVPPADEVVPEQESATSAGRFFRLKAAFRSGLDILHNAWANGLGRLRGKPAAEAESEEGKPAAAERKAGWRRESAPAEDKEVAKAEPRRWRGLLAYMTAALIGALAGSGGAYYLFSGVVAHQSAEISRQQEEIAQQKALLSGYEKILVLENRKIEVEQAKLTDQEKALAQDHKKLEEDQAKLAEAKKSQWAQLEQDRAKNAYRPDAAPPAGNKAQPGTARTGDCELRSGNIGDALKNCLQEFNRQ
jgi:hypothetical protein